MKPVGYDADMDEKFMLEAINEARSAAAEGNPAFGAIIVRNGLIIARGHSLTA
jgi:tRNA(Arg) A34 adenosine deaminase TadA